MQNQIKLIGAVQQLCHRIWGGVGFFLFITHNYIGGGRSNEENYVLNQKTNELIRGNKPIELRAKNAKHESEDNECMYVVPEIITICTLLSNYGC